MRFYCSIEGLTENWVDVEEKWTRADAMRVRTGYADFDTVDDFWTFFSEKVTGCHIVDFDGNVAASVDELTDEFRGNIDWRLAGFLGGVLRSATEELLRLGNQAGRLSGNGSQV